MQKFFSQPLLRVLHKNLTVLPSFKFGDPLKDRESVFEKEFFTKEDEKSMRKLLQKMQKQTDANRKDAISHHLEEIEKLKKIFEDNGLSKVDNALLSEILVWKLNE